MGIDAFDKIMFAEKGSGQGQQNQSLGNIAYGTEIQYPVMIDSGRAEHETAALVTVTHTGHEQKTGEFYGFLFVMYLVLQCQRAGDLAGSDQLAKSLDSSGWSSSR